MRLIIGGFFLGIGGTAFAVGVPLVNAWFPPARRGLAIGIFGVGMGGTALSAFTTIRLGDAYGRSAPFLLVAVLLGLYAVVAVLLLRSPPGLSAPGGSFLQRTTLRLPATSQLSLLYAVGFGGFVAFSVYLPTYLRNAYELTVGDAALRTAGFVVLAVAARPLGGWLSDRSGPVPVLAIAFVAAGVFAAITAAEFALVPLPRPVSSGWRPHSARPPGPASRWSPRSSRPGRSGPSPESSVRPAGSAVSCRRC